MDSRRSTRSARAFALGLGVVTLVTGPNSRSVARPVQSPEDSAFWELDVPTALRSASNSSRWVLVYFPSTKSIDLSRPPDGELIARRLGERVLGSHVNADDAEQFIQAYEVTKLPALVLLDSEGLVVRSWLGRWTAKDVVSTFRAEEKLVAKRKREVVKLLAEAEAALEEDDDRSAVRLCAEAVEKTRAGSSGRHRLLLIVARVTERGERALVVALAAEGIQRDYRLVKSLEELKKRYPVRTLRKKIDREIERLKERKIGGKR